MGGSEWLLLSGVGAGLVGKSIGIAGEHLSDYGSWMQGAFISGLRAVEHLIVK